MTYKLLSKVAEKSLEKHEPEHPVMCDYESTPMGFQKVEAFISDKHVCKFCDGKDHFLPYFDPNVSLQRCWLCANTDCLTYSKQSLGRQYVSSAPKKRSLEWALFLEMNDLGDEYVDITFEKIEQSKGKIDYMKKFIANPKGIIYMEGKPGTGKTYSSLGMCELFTRTDSSITFLTQHQLATNWACSRGIDFESKLKNVALLIIDDFGTGEIPDKFMTFFLDLINSRMQWKRRGTVITSNLDVNKLAPITGEPLSDRLKTGQHFMFENESRRSKTIL